MSNPHIIKALEVSGIDNNKAELARRLGCSQPYVHKLLRADRVPVNQVLKISALIDVPPHEIRPDIYPVPSVGAGSDESRAA